MALFQKGNNANPNGMKPGTKQRRTIVREMLVNASAFSGFKGEVDTLARTAMSARTDDDTAGEALDRLITLIKDIRAGKRK